ncbi:MAG: DUF1553 domain-containing protein, partial [Prosthecobacter sp.]|nr:DUF1553 domain-containing protein [Prosthecobacter sp.]
MRLPLIALLTLPLAAPAATINFSREIRPILSENCYFCHGPDEAKREAGLRLDVEASAKKDNDGTTAVVPGHPEKSALIERLLSTDPDEVMPPPKLHKTISPAQIALLKEWIKQGAQWGKHWSYEKVVRPAVPSAQTKGLNPIDAFIQARLADEGLKPAKEADAATLIRRVALDLTGLPPTLDELNRFLPKLSTENGALSTSAYDSLVDYYLNKPALGEHWARLWLDLARYADSAGYPSDPGREIWAYRDWVIDAFNHNMPFDRFTVEQLAGDLLPNPKDSQFIATAFHRNTMTQNEGGTSDEEFRVAAIVDRVNTTLAVWMGTTMACAQCHTHKYDPISHKEYYQFYDFLNQSADADKKDESPLHEFYTPDLERKRAVPQTELAAIEAHFVSPDPKWLAGLDAWDAAFARDLGWKHPKPLAATTKGTNEVAIQNDGIVSLARRNDTEVGTVDLPITDAKISALQIETFPAAAKSNFVITDVRADVVPPANTKGPKARFARIELAGKAKILQLAEVQVFSGQENVALKGAAKQSSLYTNAEAKRAIDGRTDGDYAKGSVSHTSGSEDNPWWEVDLKTAQSIDRIVVWNRTDGGSGSRLEGFRMVLLDDQRKTLWSREGNAAPATQLEFAIAGPARIHFTTAIADYEQSGFTAASLLKSKDKTNQGWGVGGAADQPHKLTLLAATAVAVPPGSKLRVVISQTSEHKQHTLGSFRLSFTGDTRVQEVAGTPATVLTALSQPKTKRSAAQQKAIADHYVRNVSKEAAPQRKRKMELTKQLDAFKPLTVPVMKDLAGEQRRKTNIQLRGNWEALGDEVTAAVPAIFNPLPANAPRNRLTLAQWLVSRDNPLTARVTVNRLWEALFGYGIVRTSEEFGSQGELPVHPELLDWLAAEFMDSGWDTKHQLKLMVTSQAYRQSSASTAELNERDPDNRLLARGPRFRPTGELVRDQALAVSGLLSPKMYGKPVRPLRPNLELNTAFGGKNDWVTSEGEDQHRRSLYTETKRNSPYPSFSTFDAPNREVCTIRRGRTNTPLQAFVTLNDPVFIETNQAMARRILAEGGPDTPSRLRFMFKACLSRDPNAQELAALTKLLEQSLAAYQKDPAGALKMATDPLGPAPKTTPVPDLAAYQKDPAGALKMATDP